MPREAFFFSFRFQNVKMPLTRARTSHIIRTGIMYDNERYARRTIERLRTKDLFLKRIVMPFGGAETPESSAALVPYLEKRLVRPKCCR